MTESFAVRLLEQDDIVLKGRWDMKANRTIYQSFESSDILELLEVTIQDSQGILTVADVATRTGISIHEAREVVVRLMELYEADARIDDYGSVIIHFRLPLSRKQPLLLREWLRRKQASAERSFSRYVRASVAAISILYVGWAFVLMHVAAMLVLLLGQSDRTRKSRRTGTLLKEVSRASGEYWAWVDKKTEKELEATRVTGYNLRYNASGLPMKPWIQAVVDFVLGENLNRAEPDRPREFASFLRLKTPVLTSAEIVLLTGCSLAEADERLARYCVQFRGEPTIDNDGVVIADFTQFAWDAAGDVEEAVRYWWQEREPPYATTGNHPVQNYVIVLSLMTVILIAVAASASWIPDFNGGNSVIHTLFVSMPAYLSAMMLLLATLRIPMSRIKERARLRHLLLKKLLYRISSNPHGIIDLKDVVASCPAGAQVHLREKDLKKGLYDACRLWGGEFQVAESGTIRVCFHRLAHELRAAKRVRYRTGKV